MESVSDEFMNPVQGSDEWCRSMALSIARMAQVQDGFNAHTKKAYDIYYGRQEMSDFDYLTGTGEFRMPAMVRMMPLARPYFDMLISTAQSRPFDPIVHAVDDGSVNEKAERSMNEFMQRLIQRVNKRSEQLRLAEMQLEVTRQAMDQSIAAAAQQGQMDPAQSTSIRMAEYQLGLVRKQILSGVDDVDAEVRYFEERSAKSAQANYEHQLGIGLEYLYHKRGLEDTFMKGFESLLITDQEIYCIEDVQEGQDPQVRWVNPASLVYGINPSAKYIDECPWVVEEQMMIPQDVMALYGGMLKDSERMAIAEEVGWAGSSYGDFSASSFNATGVGPVPYSCEPGEVVGATDGTLGGRTIRVRRVCWQSPRKVLAREAKSKRDPEVTHTHLISDEKELKKGEKLIQRYVNDWWEATIIGSKVIVNAGKSNFQFRDVNDIGKAYCRYVGHAYNGADRRPYSRVLAVENVVTLYNLVYYQMELLMALSGIRGFIMDKSQIPAGMSMKEWYYNLKQGVGLIDSSKERQRNGPPPFNQFQTIDMTFGNSLQQLLAVLDKLEYMIGRILGIPQQRLGELGQSDQVGTNRSAIIQSNITTEVLFHKHEKIKKRVINRLLKVIPLAWKDGKRGRFVAGEAGQKIMEIGSSDLNDRSFEVFLVNGGKEEKSMEMIQSLLMNEYQNRGTISLGQLSSIFDVRNIRELRDMISRFDKAAEEKIAAQQQGIQQAEEQKIQMEQQYQLALKKQAGEIDQMNARLAEMKIQAQMQDSQIQAQVKMQASQLDNETRKQIAQNENNVELSYLAEQRRATDIDAELRKFELLLDAAGNRTSISSPRRKNNIIDR